MLSRCEDINNVFLDEKFKLESIKAEHFCLKATKRLEEIDLVPILKKETFDIFYINIASMLNKMPDLQADIQPNQADLVCLVETWLDSKVQRFWPGKVFYSASAGRGKGVCVFAPINNDYE